MFLWQSDNGNEVPVCQQHWLVRQLRETADMLRSARVREPVRDNRLVALDAQLAKSKRLLK